jgi:predicted dehydrogenase
MRPTESPSICSSERFSDCSRRRFLMTAASLSSAVALPQIVPSSVRGAAAPSNRIHVGLIGCGHQSQRIVPSFLVHDDMQMLAVCDVNRRGDGYYYPEQVLGRETAQEWVNQHYAEKTNSGAFRGCAAYADFRQLIDRADIDAVAIVVPDHWHALIAIAAMQAGKDVYCEKPLSLTIFEGQEMVKAVRKHHRIFQTGAQFRSSPAVRRACELVRNGRLGEIRRVLSWVDPNSFESPGPGWQPQPVPEGFDYDFWLGPAPLAPFHRERCFFRWRYILDYSNGQTTNFGAHTNDIVQWALGTEDTTPVEFEDNGSEFLPEGSLFDTASKTAFRARYASGIELLCETRTPSGAKFEGTEGRLEITLGGRLATYPENLKDSVIGPDEIHLPVSNPAHPTHVRAHVDADHVRNFLDAVKNRQDPIEPVEAGYRTASLCLLGNMAQLLKRKFTWDPVAERSDDEDVNRMLRREMRTPWTMKSLLAFIVMFLAVAPSALCAEPVASDLAQPAWQDIPGAERIAIKLDTPGLLPPGWDPALAGDIVMRRLVNTSAPRVKGAHDAEFVCVGDRAYIVAEVNDLKGGESAAWPFVYVTMSIVNLETLTPEQIIDFAKGEQVFANETLPVGACFVPRILQKDANTLRCYFTSEDPGKRQSQMWYRDFDLARGEFAPTIHKAKLKTAAGTFDFQPQHFHADAAAQGFTKKASDHSFFIFDSFKRFDGRLYVALNNFSGKQNALALVHDDLVTFEVLGHFNEPQTEQLSEAAVNRLPDGSWMAICRNDKGNYHFTTSRDGRTWTPGREMPHVPNGANSKPTFDCFGGVYYLGWQEATRFQGVHRSVFNIDISRDGLTWQRKYRFETPKSFQYPTFHEHEGVIWLSVTQGDTDASRKERIMFGRLETVGQFEPQDGQTRIEWPAPPPAAAAVMKRGVKLFTDRDYVIDEMPEAVRGLPFLRTSIEKLDVQITKPGTLFALTPTIRPKAASQETALQEAGFTKVDVPEVQLFPGEINRVSLYRKEVKAGERFRFRKLVLLILHSAELKEMTPELPVSDRQTKTVLYNGIELPLPWPPPFRDLNSAEPMPVPYLKRVPSTIPIDVGRQLFVDDFLIEKTTLQRTFHRAKKFEGNPVFQAETERERGVSVSGEKGQQASVYLGHGGVFYDPAGGHFKMFYTAGWRGPLSLATSTDMKTWTRHGPLLSEGLCWTGPKLVASGSDNCVWLDLDAKNPAERVKFVTCWMHVRSADRPPGFHHSLHVSDGQTFSDAVPTSSAADDYCSFFFNPFRAKWCFSIKKGTARICTAPPASSSCSMTNSSFPTAVSPASRPAARAACTPAAASGSPRSAAMASRAWTAPAS